VRQREQQADAVDPERAEVLAEHDLDVAHRHRQQQLVGSAPPLLGPHVHRHRRHEQHQHQRHDLVEQREVGEVAGEEPSLQKRAGSGRSDEQGQEHVPGGVAEITPELAPCDRSDHGQVDTHQLAPSADTPASS
jgi:hypothetical protein